MNRKGKGFLVLFCAALLFSPYSIPARAKEPRPAGYFFQPGPFPVETVENNWHDDSRNRDVPVKIYYPEGRGPFPVIIFSHGLGGSREGYQYLGRHWASHGYVSVHLTHVGSDTGVLTGSKRPLQAMTEAAYDVHNDVNRPKDVSFAIDRLADMNKKDPVFRGRLAMDRIGMAGHSFGGYTTLAVAGETFIGPAGSTWNFGDPRVKAAIAMSAPAGKRDAATLNRTYGSIRVPCFVMTGTKDNSPIGETKAEDRRIPFDHLSVADAYLLVLNGGDHMVFSGRVFRPENETDKRFQEIILAGSTAFWDAYLKNDLYAKKWLSGSTFQKSFGKNAFFEKKIKVVAQ